MSEDDTIQEDVLLEEVKEEIVEQPKSARDSIVDELINKRKKELESEGVSFEEKPVVKEEKEEKEEPPEVSKVTVKINGVESEVDAEEITGEQREPTHAEVVAYQKQKAADQKLREASEYQKRLEERERLLEQIELEKIETAKKPTEQDDDSDDDAAALTNAILSEDFAEVKRLIRKLKGPEAVEKVTPEQIRKEAVEVIKQEKFKEKWQEAVDKFNSDYEHLAGNPILAEAVQRQVNKNWSDAGVADPWSVIKKAADEVAESIGAPKMQDKLDKKRQAAATTVKAVNAKADINREKAPPPTREETVRNMIRDREAALR